LEYWQGDNGRSYPHLRFKCPRCSIEHNVDLYPGDSNPRFASCDTCGWDSVVWIRWNAHEQV
jgi:transcription elongation factor Elf1